MSGMVQCINICKPLWLQSGAWVGKEQKKWVTSLEAIETTRPEMKVAWQKMTAAEKEISGWSRDKFWRQK